ncbi:MAG TPA: hypothetical protein VH414_13195 [Lichenihabitans sp.]|jgi:hypothetical protein|nr:hypothetical protein [Lichenihabitans sp.]
MSVVRLTISEDKIKRYLLDLSHPVGGSKARFFIDRGFNIATPDVLAEALTAHASGRWPGSSVVTPYGIKHRIVGPMPCPDGSAPVILAVWQVQTGRTSADFVTAYPKPAGLVFGSEKNDV